MRKLLVVAWFLLPAIGLTYHYGPGQRALAIDRAAALLSEADRLAAESEWPAAVEAYDRALAALPEDEVEQIRHARLGRSRAMMFTGGLPQANRDLEGLLRDLTQDPDADPRLVSETRSALANSQYYMTWLLRLEGAPEDDWRPYVEGARQNYKLLDAREDLDSTLRLARMDLSELQAMPLPSQ